MVKPIINQEDKVYVSEDGTLIVNGQEYIESKTKYKKIDGIEHVDKVLYRKFDRKDFNKKVNLIVDKIKSKVTKEELVKELIGKHAIDDINKLYDILKSKKKPKITKQDGCIGIKVGSGKPKTGGRYFQLIE